eukprot:5808004-Alexandrium_andersonii.AAC.1
MKECCGEAIEPQTTVGGKRHVATVLSTFALSKFGKAARKDSAARSGSGLRAEVKASQFKEALEGLQELSKKADVAVLRVVDS